MPGSSLNKALACDVQHKLGQLGSHNPTVLWLLCGLSVLLAGTWMCRRVAFNLLNAICLGVVRPCVLPQG